MIKNVIFDVNKVLRILNPDSINSYFSKAQLEKYGDRYNNVTIRDYFNTFFHNKIYEQYDLGLISQNALILALSKEFNEPVDVLSTILEKRCLKKNNTIFKPMITLIKNLRKSGIKTYILSNMGKEAADVLKVYLGQENFDGVIFSCEIHKNKPNANIYEHAINEFNIDAKESLFVDDTFENLIPFNLLGGRTYLFDYKQMKKCIQDIKRIVLKQ